MSRRIALIHAVTVAIAPVQDAFRRLWPDARCTNLLDDALTPDRERDGELTQAMRGRIGALADHAASTGADGVLFTCSAFGEAIEQAAARLPLPVLKPSSKPSRPAKPCVSRSQSWRSRVPSRFSARKSTPVSTLIC